MSILSLTLSQITKLKRQCQTLSPLKVCNTVTCGSMGRTCFNLLKKPGGFMTFCVELLILVNLIFVLCFFHELIGKRDRRKLRVIRWGIKGLVSSFYSRLWKKLLVSKLGTNQMKKQVLSEFLVISSTSHANWKPELI